MKLTIVLTAFLLNTACYQKQPTSASTNSNNSSAQLPSCEWCGAKEAPEDITWQCKIAPDDEPGEKLVLTGTVYQSDGKTPAPNVIIYAYHTNAKGIYKKRGDETGNGQRHGYLRGWVKTNEKGQYRFETIKPASYPSTTIEAHIHMTILESGKDEYWIESTLFEDDAFVSKSKKEASSKLDRFKFVISLSEENGILKGTRNIYNAP